MLPSAVASLRTAPPASQAYYQRKRNQDKTL